MVQGRIHGQKSSSFIVDILLVSIDVYCSLHLGCFCVFQYGKGELKFSSLTFDDSGMYQCLAENIWGIKYANAELRVIGMSVVFNKFQKPKRSEQVKMPTGRE